MSQCLPLPVRGLQMISLHLKTYTQQLAINMEIGNWILLISVLLRTYVEFVHKSQALLSAIILLLVYVNVGITVDHEPTNNVSDNSCGLLNTYNSRNFSFHLHHWIYIIVCGHCFSQRHRRLAKMPPDKSIQHLQNHPAPVYEDVLASKQKEHKLELKENVAYGPLLRGTVYINY